MMKFTTQNLVGYGFDLAADRVVRFNKHPDGTYLNTRATYSINRAQYTHFELRSKAIQESSSTIKDPVASDKQGFFSKHKRSWVIGLMALVMLLVGKCSVSGTFTTDTRVSATSNALTSESSRSPK